MAAQSPSPSLDGTFYKAADVFFPEHAGLGLTYDDVTLATLYSETLPRETNLETELHERLRLRIPVISADMDTVTEAPMAIAMALNGGLGLIHCNLPEREQLSQVSRVKNNVHGLIQEPIKVVPDQTIGDVLTLVEQKSFGFRTFPVVDKDNVLLGLLPGHTVHPRYAATLVSQAMTPRAQVHTVHQRELGKNPIARADRFFNEHIGIHKLLVVDDGDHLCGLFTISDIERIMQERHSQLKPARDEHFRLVCGAAVTATRNSTGELDGTGSWPTSAELVERGVDTVAVSTAHGFSKGVGDTVRLIRENFSELPIIAGNVTSGEGVAYLGDCGANIIKIGQGPGSICTTRIVAGVGIPQLTALYVCAKEAEKRGVRILADGGITKSGDIVKALTLSHGVICGGLLAGCPEAPGQLMEINGKLYKQYRGMGSPAAMQAGSAARYGHLSKDSVRKVAAEGVEALKEVSPPLDIVLTQLAGGIQSGMGYRAPNLAALREKARYIQITTAGMRESAPHDIVEVKTGN